MYPHTRKMLSAKGRSDPTAGLEPAANVCVQCTHSLAPTWAWSKPSSENGMQPFQSPVAPEGGEIAVAVRVSERRP
jgi:hypothetical protein